MRHTGFVLARPTDDDRDLEPLLSMQIVSGLYLTLNRYLHPTHVVVDNCDADISVW